MKLTFTQWKTEELKINSIKQPKEYYWEKYGRYILKYHTQEKLKI